MMYDVSCKLYYISTKHCICIPLPYLDVVHCHTDNCVKYAILSASMYPFLGSIVVSISACHAEDPGSIPGRGGMNFFFDYHAIHHQLVV